MSEWDYRKAYAALVEYAALRHTCPRCGAGINEPCHSARYSDPVKPHRARVRIVEVIAWAWRDQ